MAPCLFVRIDKMGAINSLYSNSVGVLVGMTGGGSLMAPSLVVPFGFHPATALGQTKTAKLAA
jgi:uncharacterized membrane protein YfcA